MIEDLKATLRQERLTPRVRPAHRSDVKPYIPPVAPVLFSIQDLRQQLQDDRHRVKVPRTRPLRPFVDRRQGPRREADRVTPLRDLIYGVWPGTLRVDSRKDRRLPMPFLEERTAARDVYFKRAFLASIALHLLLIPLLALWLTQGRAVEPDREVTVNLTEFRTEPTRPLPPSPASVPSSPTGTIPTAAVAAPGAVRVKARPETAAERGSRQAAERAAGSASAHASARAEARQQVAAAREQMAQRMEQEANSSGLLAELGSGHHRPVDANARSSRDVLGESGNQPSMFDQTTGDGSGGVGVGIGIGIGASRRGDNGVGRGSGGGGGTEARGSGASSGLGAGSGLGSGTGVGTGVGGRSGAVASRVRRANQPSRSGNSQRDFKSIEAYIASQDAAIRACYANAKQADPDLAGSVTVGFRIKPDGRAVGVRVASSSLRSDAVERCMQNKIRSWSFPAAPSGDEEDLIISDLEYVFSD